MTRLSASDVSFHHERYTLVGLHSVTVRFSWVGLRRPDPDSREMKLPNVASPRSQLRHYLLHIESVKHYTFP